MLRLSREQEGSLAYDVVRRHARADALQVDEHMRHQRDQGGQAAGAHDHQRLQALRQVLKDRVRKSARTGGPHLLVDLDQCATQWTRALDAGATYRESAASAQMLGCAALGLRWLGDERLCVGATPGANPALQPPEDAAALKQWAEANWTDRYAQALARMKVLQAPAVYALDRALAAKFDPASLRNVAHTVFRDAEHDRLARFVHEERQLFRAVRDGPGPIDPRLESLCIAADLVHGLGRFVRLAVALQRQVPMVAFLYPHLVKAIHELAE